MRIIILLAFSISVAKFSFAQADRTKPARITSKWLKNETIIFNYSFPDSESFSPERKPGKNWIFEYIYEAPENPDVSDDELTEVISFQIPPLRKNSFRLRDKDLVKAKAYFLRGCFCADRGFSLLKKGSITGTRINSMTWQIQIRVIVEGINGEYARNYKGKFKLQKN